MMSDQKASVPTEGSCAVDAGSPDVEMLGHRHAIKGDGATPVVDAGVSIELGPTNIVQQHGRDHFGAWGRASKTTIAPVLCHLPTEPCVRGLGNGDGAG